MSGSDSAALALFAIYALTVASWLFGGLAPVLNASFPTVLATFSEWAEGSGALASLSRRVVQATYSRIARTRSWPRSTVVG